MDLSQKNFVNNSAICNEVFNQSPDGLIIIDATTGSILKTNQEAEKMFLLSAEALQKKNYSELFNLTELTKEKNADNLIELSDSNNLTKKFDNVIIQSNGEELPVEVASRIILIEGQLCQVVSIRDIKERKIYEKKLLEAKRHSEELEQLKFNFLANISHELRTPLISILGYSEILKEELEDELLIEMVSGIHRGGQRLLDTLSLILDMTLIKNKDISFRESLINPIYTIEELISIYEARIKSKGLFLKKEFFAKNCFINVDARMYYEILKSLLDNAYKYTDQGFISIKVSECKKENLDYVKIAIKDTGIGIEEEQLNLVFQDFRQASEGTTRDYQGTGVGLTIAKRFTEFNKGLIEVDSKYGSGSQFCVYFPLFNTEEFSTDKQDKEPGDFIQRTNDILLLESHPSTREIINLTIGDICNIKSVKKANDVIKLMTENYYHMIILDVDSNNYYEVIYLLDELNKTDKCKIKVAILPDYERLDVNELSKRGISFTYYKPLGKASFRDFVKHFLSV